MFKLTPTNTEFYDFFDRISDVLVQASEHFHAGMERFSNPQKLAAEIKELEHQGDSITHDTMALLHKSFITPLERSDIRRLIVSLDDVLDALDDASSLMALYEITDPLPEVRDLAAVLVKATKGVRLAVNDIRNLRKKNDILQHCVEIHHYEDEGDRIYDKTLARLFKSGMDPVSIIKWKDIIEDLENSIDCCQDVSVVVEGIVLENS